MSLSPAEAVALAWDWSRRLWITAPGSRWSRANPMHSMPSGPDWAFPRSPRTSGTRPPPTASLPTFGRTSSRLTPVRGRVRRTDAAPEFGREGCSRAGRRKICWRVRVRDKGAKGNNILGGTGGLSKGPPPQDRDRRAELLALTGELRPELHRYCARLIGSVIDGEDVVQDTFARALVALEEMEEMPPLRPWLFRIAHNRALDLLRGRAVRMTEPIEAASDVADPASPDPVEMLMRQEAVKTAVSRFAELPTVQRSIVILKDVLDESLSEIANLLDLTVDDVRASR